VVLYVRLWTFVQQNLVFKEFFKVVVLSKRHQLYRSAHAVQLDDIDKYFLSKIDFDSEDCT